ncbi:hypothetical protein [Falsigemmobacter faecalis]|jgi:hypothetical protein|uniref:Uncharacterized protein n=1 Tax=Falsigemmobacter faecalis TaxID=2488730 RepID=A0A3P3DAR0_9RHOB|nr:hypothetical protein [Falsigemmobacter faecalis]RRH71291.1 hypothetical protein EG244_16585 [Falsigemmobacter faecalis]
MLENDDMTGFAPEVAKLIAAFALAAQHIGMDEDVVHRFFQTALENYEQGYASVPSVRHDA